MGYLLLTLVCCTAVGFLLQRRKVPGGMMIGSVIGALLLNILFQAAYMPGQAKVTAQILAGGFIGCTVDRDDIGHMRRFLKPAGILLGVHFLLNLCAGMLIYLISPLDAVTAFMGAVPGGLSDIPLIAADMGADAPKVFILQFIRMLVGIGIFPTLIQRICKEDQTESGKEQQELLQTGPWYDCLLTLAVAAVCGTAGYLLRVQAGTFLFALLSVLALKMIYRRAFLPLWVKRVAQVLSGAYIGSSMGKSDLLELRYLLVPIAILLMGYCGACFFIGHLLQRFCGMSRREGMLTGIPAGASDMALISSDMGMASTDLIMLQVIRLIVVVSVFPQVISLITGFL